MPGPQRNGCANRARIAQNTEKKQLFMKGKAGWKTQALLICKDRPANTLRSENLNKQPCSVQPTQADV